MAVGGSWLVYVMAGEKAFALRWIGKSKL